MSDLVRGFKSFLMQGNVIVSAVGLAIALAFSTLVKAFTDSIITPLVNAAGGGGTNGLGFTIRSQHVDFRRPSPARAAADRLHRVLAAIIYFVIFMAVVYFAIVVPYRAYSRRRGVAVSPIRLRPRRARRASRTACRSRPRSAATHRGTELAVESSGGLAQPALGPEPLEGGVERDGGHVLPQPVGDPDHERLVDVELDPVAAAGRAVDRDAQSSSANTVCSRLRYVPPVSIDVRRRNSTTSRRPWYSPLITVWPGTRHTMSRASAAEIAIGSLPKAAKTRRTSAAFGCSGSLTPVARRASRRPPPRSP